MALLVARGNYRVCGFTNIYICKYSEEKHCKKAREFNKPRRMSSEILQQAVHLFFFTPFHYTQSAIIFTFT